MSTDAVLIYATFPDREGAEATGRALVEERLCACVNLLDSMISVYRWQGAIETGRETVMIAKTTRALSARLCEAIVVRHPYDVPAVVVLPIEGGNPAFVDWIGEETRGSDT